MASVNYVIDDHVAIVTMNDGENRFNSEFFEAFNEVLDEIENKISTRVLVVTSGHEKIWSNGIDLEWFMPLLQENPAEAEKFPFELTALYKRILYFPMVTIAAINGHAFAGGAVLASAFDFRFMRSGRGYFCIPEVDIRIPLAPSMIAIMRKAVPEQKFLEMQYLGIRLTAEECVEHNIILKACPLEDLMNEVMIFAKKHKKNQSMIKIMKQLSYKHFEEIYEKDDIEWFSSGMTGMTG